MTDSPDSRDAKKAARRERKCALARARYYANRDRILAEKRHKYRTDPEYRARMLTEASKRDRRQDTLRWKYGLSPEAYDRMFKRQHGLCLICWKPFTSTPHVDHDHDSGFVRALFCDNCNIGCGRFFDNPAFLRRAADVMEFFKKHKERILRGEPAALKEGARLKTALLDVDISPLLPPKDQLPSFVPSAAELPPRKHARKAAPAKVVNRTKPERNKPERKKHAQPRRGRKQQGRAHHAARAGRPVPKRPTKAGTDGDDQLAMAGGARSKGLRQYQH
jgi:Recombination endonuclease VII